MDASLSRSIRAAYASAGARLAILEAVLRERNFVAGSMFTAADIVAGLTARRWFALAERFAHELPVGAPMDNVSGWLARITARDTFLAVEMQMPALA